MAEDKAGVTKANPNLSNFYLVAQKNRDVEIKWTKIHITYKTYYTSKNVELHIFS